MRSISSSGGEHQFSRVLVGLQWLAVPFAAAVDQISAALLQTLHGEWWAGAVAQQALPPGAVGRFDAHPGIDRETATLAAGRCTGGHVFGDRYSVVDESEGHQADTAKKLILAWCRCLFRLGKA